MFKKITFLFALSIGITLFSSDAYACSCLAPEGARSKLVKEARDSSEAIFSGKVIRISQNPGSMSMQSQYMTVELAVIDVWKGNIGRTVTIRTGSNDGNCRFPFEKNKTYLVYAENSTMYSPTEVLSTGICSRTAALANGRSDIRYLGTRRKPKRI